MTYDFTLLSPDDFEDLVCDLLSREWNVRLESFKPGKDGGIDLRHSARLEDDTVTVVQCKRYGPHRFSALRADLQDELPKLAMLKPDRYVVATSVPLNPKQKDEILTLLSPWCTTAQDVYGADEINQLIRIHPEVERSHFKLWMSSTAVMERILHARIFAVTDDTLETVRREFGALVVHKGFNRALDILATEHHVAIVGNPGIGKTTLARMLLCHYVAEGFEPVTVIGHMDDAWTALHLASEANRKVAIFYDDFLGRLRFDVEKFAKNEESSLLQLIDKVRRTSNLRFLLTTREYILSDAQRLHGAFASRARELALCTVSLGDYTRTKRAQILFNHLYFSDLPSSKIDHLVRTKTYLKIVAHRHFNPRVVESICRNANSRALTDGEFVAYVEQEFDNPAKIWEHPFVNDISAEARLVVALLWMFDGMADLEWLRSMAVELDGSPRLEEASLRFDEAIRELDGNFIATNMYPEPYGRKTFVIATFNNPSVEEFIGHWLSGQPLFLGRLVDAMTTLDQADKVANCLRASHIAEDFRLRLWRKLRAKSIECRGAKTGKLVNYSDGAGGVQRKWAVENANLAREMLVLLRIDRETTEEDGHAKWLDEHISGTAGWRALLAGSWRNQQISWSVRSLCEWIRDKSTWSSTKIGNSQAAYLNALIESVRDEDASTAYIATLEDLIAAVDPSLLQSNPRVRECLADAVRLSAASALDDAPDGDWLTSEAETLRSIEGMLSTSFSSECQSLDDASQSLREREYESPKRAPEERRYSGEAEEILDLDGYFADLLHR